MAKKNDSSYAEKIIIDEKNKLVFKSEDEVLKYFDKHIQKFESEFLNLRPKNDFSDEEAARLESFLENTLESPDEVWVDSSVKGLPLHIYIKKIESPDEEFYYIALTYVADSIPTFVFLHFPTKSTALVDKYRRGEPNLDRYASEVENGCIEGDALSEGDDLAIGLFKAMMVLRQDDDIGSDEFRDYADLREGTIEEPDEIWRNNGLDGNTLVNFIKDFSVSGENLYYVVVTLEDTSSNSHALLFSFPSEDESLVERYRHGENLHAEEVVQESSH
ncbi:MAG: peptidase [Bdellovibrionaceae bacterium]|nr:peptidase [Pseudobdellovibrionaceae bacterium]